MPALVTATVVRWKVDRTQTPHVTVLRDTRPVSLVVADGANTADLSPLLGQYILDVTRPDATKSDATKPEKPAPTCMELVEAMRDGLLQAYAPQRTQFTAPPVPLLQVSATNQD